MLQSPSKYYIIQSFLHFKEKAVREQRCSPDPSSQLCKFIQNQIQPWGTERWIHSLYYSPLLCANLVSLWQSSNSKMIFLMYLLCSTFTYQKLWFTTIRTLILGSRRVFCTWKMLNKYFLDDGWMSEWKSGWKEGWMVNKWVNGRWMMALLSGSLLLVGEGKRTRLNRYIRFLLFSLKRVTSLRSYYTF